ncbi:phytanoyl-CoA dioxygenase family protein [Fibrella forsythiae]|uniref:Phytanoyl-CoA dioxygenase family protein n=1 Tax=Fibrella forsythiae TaxID=2817061 RepID=A0ABS3JMY0_9BACT|nr:phytanoyl-CoA dioxygenase family protein [Fibrella forsythiae]MBO0950761.1 phytanoyl-CoA dioxygenase family protein [Fibrella forsythiae]
MRKLQCPKFELGETLTAEQKNFFDKHGIIIFPNFLNRDTVKLFLSELARIEQEWLADGRDKINGVPLKFGRDEAGNKVIQRSCFLSHASQVLHEFLQDPRLQTVVDLLQPYEGRMGENEKDGLVLNNYVRTPSSQYSQMGWHTDSPRDIFLGQRIMPMLNVGIHLDDCPMENGGLRVLPGTHKQSTFRMLFGKKYFVDNNPDPREVGLDIQAGDLTVHDGRIWHRVQQSPLMGEASRRRVMYVPVVTGKYKPKNEFSKTPFYHRFIQKVNI